MATLPNKTTIPYESTPVITTSRLTIKDVEGRVNYFDDATMSVAYVLSDKFYKIMHSKGIEYYNPSNVIFIEF